MKHQKKKWHGSKWLRSTTRHAIYCRDNHTCVYCGKIAYVHNIKLTIDHITPREKGGSNTHTNLVTSCGKCNSSKQDKTKRQWFQYLKRQGINTDQVSRRVLKQSRKQLKPFRNQVSVLKQGKM